VGDLIAEGEEVFKQDPEERFLIDNWANKARGGWY
jgi:hypothetical protein